MAFILPEPHRLMMQSLQRAIRATANRRHARNFRVCAVALACVLAGQGAWAVEVGHVPDAGALMRGTEQLQQFYTPPPELPEKPKHELRPKAGQQTFVVKRFRITGASLVPTRDIQAVLEPWLDQEITFADLEDALQAVADLYQQRGWYARPQLPEQDLVDGIVTIKIIEGKLGDVKVDESAGARISQSRIVKTLTARQDLGAPLNLNDLNRAVSILNDTPGIQVSTAMAAGATPETTDLIAQVQPKRWWGLNGSIDNFGARSTGYGRLSVNGNADTPLGLGDQITANYVGSEGTQFGRIGYTLPVGYDGLRFGANYAALSYNTVGSFAETTKQYGTAEIGELLVTYPLLRHSTGNINTALTYDKKRYYNASVTTQGVTTAQGDKYITVGTWSLNGDHYDSLFGGGAFYWGSNWSVGHLDFSSSPTLGFNDSTTANAAGQYSKYTANLSRLQRITDTTQLWLSWQGQLASKNLDSSEDFSLGGPQGVRAYPNYEAQGDQGWLGTIEGRRMFGDQWQGSAFFDAGRIMINRYVWSTSPQPNLYNLYGAGLGMSYSLPGQMTGKAMVAHRIGSNPCPACTTPGADNDGTHLPWRFWLSLAGTF